MKLKKKLVAMRRLQAGSLALIMILSVLLGNLVVKTTKTVFAGEIHYEQTNKSYLKIYENNNDIGYYSTYLFKDQNGLPAYCLAEGLTSAASVSGGYTKSLIKEYFGSDNADRIKNILRNGYPLNQNYWENKGITAEAQQYATTIALHAVLEKYEAPGNTMNDKILEGYGFLRDYCFCYGYNDVYRMENVDESMDVKSMVLELCDCGDNLNKRLFDSTVKVSNPTATRTEQGYVGSWDVQMNGVNGAVSLDFTQLPSDSKVYINEGENDINISLTSNSYNYKINGSKNITVKVVSSYSSIENVLGIGLTARVYDLRYVDDSNNGNAFFTINSDDSYQPMVAIESVEVETDSRSNGIITFEASSVNIEITKRDSNNNVVLPGAVYGLYSDAECTNKVNEFPVTDENGKASINSLPYNTYYVREITPPDGYQLSSTIYTVTPNSSLAITEVSLDVSNSPYTKIKVVKTDDNTDKLLPGAVYTIYSDSDCTMLIEKLPETDEKGEAISSYIEPGTYYIKETKAPEHYDLDERVYQVNAVIDSTMTVYVHEEGFSDVVQGQMKLVKKDSHSNIPLAGAVYELYSDEACTNLLETLPTTNASGESMCTGWYSEGTYYLKEKVAPENYELSNEVKSFCMGASVTLANVTVTDIPKIKVKVVKSDVYSEAKVAGAVYGLYSDAACTNLVETLPETDENGETVSGYVSQKTYYVKELQAPEHYDLSDEIYTVDATITPEMTVYEVTTKATDKRQGQVEVLKLDENTRTPLKGAVYGLYSDAACTNLLETLPATNNEGKAICAGWYSEGTYYLKEIVAPENYTLSDTVYTFEMGGMVTISYQTVTDVAMGKLVLYKTDAHTNILLAGAEYGFYSDPKCKNLLEKLVTDENGEATTGMYNKGTYYIREIKAPEHYTLSNKIYTINLGGSEVRVEKIATDEVKGKISVLKIDANNNEKVLKGAVYSVYADEKCTSLITVLPETDENGKATSIELNYGKYYVKETKAPADYDLSDKVFDVVVGGENAVIELKGEDVLKGHIKVVKTETDDKNAFVKGAIYGVYSDANCKQLVEKVAATDEKGVAVSNLLAKGTYYVQEITAPYGYTLSKKIYKAVVNSNTETVTNVSDTEQVGYIQVYKYGERLVAYENGQFKWEKGFIAGAEFTIYDMDGKVVDVIKTTNEGKELSKPLKLGKYIIKETKNPLGHIIDEKGKEIEIKINNSVDEYTTKDYENVNTRQKLDLVINKLSKTTNQAIEGVEFTLFADENVCDYKGNVIIKKGEAIETVTTGKDGIAKFESDLPHIKYSLVETKTPVEYVALDEPIEIDYTNTFGYDETFMDTRIVYNEMKMVIDEDEPYFNGTGQGEVGPDIPDTGDHTKIKILVGMMIAAIIALFGASTDIFVEKKKTSKVKNNNLRAKDNM